MTANRPLIQAIILEVKEPPQTWSRGSASPVPIPISGRIPPPQIAVQGDKSNYKERCHHQFGHQALQYREQLVRDVG